MPEKQPNLDSLFEAAIQIESAADRAAFLARSCGEDVELRKQVEKLLQSDEKAGSFLDKPPAEMDVTLVPKSSADQRTASLQAGLAAAFGEDQSVVIAASGHSVLKSLGQTMNVPRVVLREGKVGTDPIVRPQSPEVPQSTSDSRYRLDGEIARGGMGAILRGRDNDLGRDLAIKVLLDSHKDKPEIIQRFVEEAQIGGQLQHPGIAPIYELGQFADKRPFFAMKLVKGETLAKLLADRDDAADERSKFIGIFEQICQTMAYAHSRGVIHRDLKPANIMVGAFGEVQVMDWGLAKVLTTGGVADEKKAKQKHRDQSIIQTRRSEGSDTPGSFGSTGSETQIGSVMGTPAYMPPEQALGEVDRLDERSDVFGLGAILCEILTGQPPYVAEDGTQVYRLASRGRLDDAFVRLDACGADTELISLNRHCLELEPTDRPRDAGVLVERVTAYLESVETKLRQTELQRGAEAARAEEALHTVREQEAAARAQRRAGRLLYAIATLLFIGLMGAGFTANHFRKLERLQAKLTQEKSILAEEKEAARVRESERAEGERLAKLEAQAATEQARKQLTQIENGIEVITSIFTDLDIQQVREGTEPLEAVLAKRLVKAAGQLEGDSVGDPVAVARLQDRLGESLTSLAYPNEAVSLLTKARQTLQTTLGDDHPETLTISCHLACAYADDEKGRVLFEEIVPRMKASLGEDHLETLTSMGNLALRYGDLEKNEQALVLFEEIVPRMKASLGEDHLETLKNMNRLAGIYRKTQQLDRALPLMEEAIARMKASVGEDHVERLYMINNLAVIYRDLGQFNKAMPLFETSLRLVRARMGKDHPETIICSLNLAYTYWQLGQIEQALRLLEETLLLAKARLGDDHPRTVDTINIMVQIYRHIGQYEKSLRLLEESLPLAKSKLGDNHQGTLAIIGQMAAIYREVGQYDQALELFEDLVLRSKTQYGDDDDFTLAVEEGQAQTYAAAGQYEKAFALFEEILRPVNAKALGRPSALKALGNHAEACQAAGRLEEASEKAREVATVAHQLFPPDSPALAEKLALASLILVQTQAFAEAEGFCRECLAIREKTEPDVWTTFYTRSLLGAALLGQQKYPEAEPLLLAGYEGLKEREAAISKSENIRLREGLERLVALYTDWHAAEQDKGYDAKAAEWQTKLDVDNAEAATATPASTAEK